MSTDVIADTQTLLPKPLESCEATGGAQPKPFKIDDLPQDIQDFINKHGGIGLLVEKCMELNPQWVDSAMAWVFIIQWAREELKSPVIINDDIQT